MPEPRQPEVAVTLDAGCSPLTQEEQAALTELAQGDVLTDVNQVVVAAPDGSPRLLETPDGVVIVSQTCDVVQATRPAVQVARLVVRDGAFAGEARDGKRPRFVHVPGLDDPDRPGVCAFADLEFVATLEKGYVAGKPFQRGAPSDADVRVFARAVARKYGRFAFPDVVTWWLEPLAEVIASKSRKPGSPEGRALRDVVEFRVEATPDWAGESFDLTLCVIVSTGTLPALDGEQVDEASGAISAFLEPTSGDGPSSAQIAERLLGTSDPVDRGALWQALGDSWAAKCTPKARAPEEAKNAQVDVVAEVIAVDEFSLMRARRSEMLDLDHLSVPDL